MRDSRFCANPNNSMHALNVFADDVKHRYICCKQTWNLKALNLANIYRNIGPEIHCHSLVLF